MKKTVRYFAVVASIWATQFQAFATTPPDSLLSIASNSIISTDSTTHAPQKLNVFQKILKYFDDSNKADSDKKFDFGIIGGPHYNSTTKFGLGITASGSYRTRRDSLTTPSNVALYGDATTTGFFLIGIEGHNYFPQNSFRIDYNLSLQTFPGDFWGIGYEMGNNNRNKSSYNRLDVAAQIDWLARLYPHLYGGISTCFNYVKGSKFTNITLLEGQPTEVISTGVGISLVYDSRDFITNAYQGIYTRVNQRFYPAFLGNKATFSHTDFTLDYYQRAWKGAVIALDIYGDFNYGNVPWNMLALFDGSNRMRGYYEGRYRDKNLIAIQVEVRQHIWRRNGIAVWVGAGNVFPSFSQFDWGHTLPNYGIGYRWEFKNRVNIRLDYGFGKKGQSGFLFNINEAF